MTRALIIATLLLSGCEGKKGAHVETLPQLTDIAGNHWMFRGRRQLSNHCDETTYATPTNDIVVMRECWESQ